MTHAVVSAAVAIVALITAAYVDVHGSDPAPYLYAGLTASGYAAGSMASKLGKRKS